MRRYFPPGSNDDAPVTANGVRRILFTEWQDLWKNDRGDWAGEIRERPKRFDERRWQFAVRSWRNDIPGSPTSGDPERPLEGVPILVKDLFDVPGERTTCSSAVLLSGNGPDVPVADRYGELLGILTAAGAHVAGRTHMNEFAYGLDGRNRYTGDCGHPLSPQRISGGSSSGSAWAVSAGVVPCALGTDTGGSIRLPAALCGIYGVRLGWNRSRLTGVFPLAPSLDTVGWFTHALSDMQTMLRVVLGTEKSGNADSAPPLSRIGVLLPPGITLAPEILRIQTEVVRRLEADGVIVERVESPELLGDDSVDAYNVIGSSEAWQVHRGWIEQYGDLYDPVVRGLMERGKHWSDERRERADATRSAVRAIATELFRNYDAILMPATVVASPRAEEADGEFRAQILRLNAFGSLAGLPALSLPVHIDAIRSGGVQILVSREREDRLEYVLALWNRLIGNASFRLQEAAE